MPRRGAMQAAKRIANLGTETAFAVSDGASDDRLRESGGAVASGAEFARSRCALDHHHAVRGVAQLHQQREVQAGRAATDAQNIHERIV